MNNTRLKSWCGFVILCLKYSGFDDLLLFKKGRVLNRFTTLSVNFLSGLRLIWKLFTN
jgi:hypothetical protein